MRSAFRYYSMRMKVMAFKMKGAYGFLSLPNVSSRVAMRFTLRMLMTLDLSRQPFLSACMIASVILLLFYRA